MTLWTMVQSGNYSNNSCPFNVKDGGDPKHFIHGNRDTGLAIKSAGIARFFTTILRSDMKLELAGAGLAAAPAADAETTFATAAPTAVPPRLFASKPFQPTSPIDILPILSPDNYMEAMPGVLEKARKSIFIEQQYIRTGQPGIQKLLQAIVKAQSQNQKLDVRIVLAKPLGDQKAVNKSVAEMKALSQFGLQIGKHVRLLNPKNFVHCHNKLILIDGETLLVSSQNWSDSAVLKNREAGLLMTFPALAKYYTDIFLSDWDNGVKSLAGLSTATILAATALNSGKKLVRLELGDYVEV